MNRLSVPERQITAASSWGICAGLIGSLCCLGPSTAVLLGLGSSSLLLGVQLDQTWTLVASSLLLVGGIVGAIRQARRSTVCGIKRWRQPLLILATFALAYGSLGLLLPRLAAQEVARREAIPVAVEQSPIINVGEAAPAPTLHQMTLIVEKMNCPPCAAKVQNRLSRKPGVRALRAEAYNEEVIITYDPTQATGEALMKLLPRQYGVTLIRDELLP